MISSLESPHGLPLSLFNAFETCADSDELSAGKKLCHKDKLYDSNYFDLLVN